MNLLQHFIREEPIAGLEISDTALRLALLEFTDKEKSSIKIKDLLEEPLEAGVIEDGALKDTQRFLASLQNLLKGNGSKVRYVIISLPSDQIYSRIFSFPQSVQEERLEEAVNLAMSFQLPIKPSGSYIDWEKLGEGGANEVFLAGAQKSVVDGFLDVLKQAGLNTVAVEFHPMSLSRAMRMPEKSAALVKIPAKKSTGIFIIKDRIIRFGRILPSSRFSQKTLNDEVKKISDFYEVEDAPLWMLMNLDEVELLNIFSDERLKKEGWKWLVALGASLRGLLPRAQDNLVSLMPVGTEEAYERQKALTFAEFMSNITIAVATFFAVIFAGVWLLMLFMQQNFSRQFETLSALPAPQDSVQLEERAKKLNALLTQTDQLFARMPAWSTLLEELRSRITSGITVNTVSLPSPEAVFSISGIAQNRGQLNLFKKSLEGSEMFSEVAIPLTNLEQKENISFSVSFKMKDPSILYKTN